jgi:prophage DNA circulation protein
MSDGGTAMLDELLEPVTRALSREVAQALVNVKASDTAQARISELAEKCNEGLLTSGERAEYESYVQAVDMISVLQTKARLWLARHSAA